MQKPAATQNCHWIMDYETMAGTFIGCFEHFNKKEQHLFIIDAQHNDLEKLYAFFEQNITNKEMHISYNGLAFDAQITQWIIQHYQELLKLSGLQVAQALYGYAQHVISKARAGEFSDYAPHQLKIKQLDIFKMNHWDNPAKMSSLKWIQYSMDWHNVEEMPIHHSTVLTTQEELDMVIAYCWNDVASTKNIFHLSKEQVLLRKTLSQEYKLDLYSASEPRISKELFSYFLCEKLGLDKKELRQRRTPRSHIVLADCILPYIKFKTPEFQGVLDYMKSKVITETKGALEYSINYKGVKTVYGLGGIHGAIDPGVYEAGAGYIIMSSDVTSFYPNLAIKNGFHPAHLPKKEFLDLYEWFFEERKKIPKKDPKNYVYKIILNSTYGLSNDANSFLYDPLMTMQITINGQLQLSMLYEMLAEAIPGCVPLMQNTDGLEMKIPVSYREKYLEICGQWEKITSLQLEHDEYAKMIIADVNNYIAIATSGSIKCKGRFEWEAQDKKSAAILHKNKSFLIIPKAIYNYFVHNMSPEETIDGSRNIFDFCGGGKAKGDWSFEERYVEDSVLKTKALNKLVRYYVSPKGSKIIKVHQKDGREIQLEAGRWKQQTCNKISMDTPFEEYDLDREFYLQAIYKEINNIDKKQRHGFAQLALF